MRKVATLLRGFFNWRAGRASCIIGALALGLLFACIYRPIWADSISDEAEAAFRSLEADLPGKERIAGQDGGQLAWGESYVLMGYVAMYEGTGNTEYFYKAMLRFDEVLNIRDDKRQVKDELRERVLPAWSTSLYTEGKRYAWVANSGMIIYPIARWAYLVKRDVRLQERYGTIAEGYIKAVKETVASFDEDWREDAIKNEGYYYDRYLKRDIPFNQQNALGRALVALWLATGNGEYRLKAEKLAWYFKNRLVQNGTRYIWPYWAVAESTEDIGHAAINVDFAFMCYKVGIVFTEEDMKKFCETLKFCAREDQGFSHYVDGTGGLALSRLMGLWGHLGFLDSELRVLLHHYFKQNWPERDRTWMTCAAYLVETGKSFSFDAVVHQ